MTNNEKEAICQQHRIYLSIIYSLGNKVIVMKQLFAYAKALGITNTYSVFLGHIHELVSAEIIRQEAFTAYNKTTSLHMLTLRKFGIRYIEGKQNSQQIGAVPKSNTNERILISLYKNCYILDKIIPRIQNKKLEVTLESIVDTLESDKSALLFNKNQALEYMNNYWGTLKQHLDMSNFKGAIKDLQLVKSKRKAGLKKGSYSTYGKGIGNHFSFTENAVEEVTNQLDEDPMPFKLSNKQRRLDFYSIDSMLTAFIYIVQMKQHNDENGGCYFTITILIFDVNNKKNIYGIATHIACVYGMLKRYFVDDLKFKLKVGVVSLDEEASNLVKSEAEKIIREPRSKELKGNRLENTLADWGITPGDRECIEIQYTHYDITNKYLQGKKYLNLIRR
ncbi:hypothetical protein PTQ21_06170 [Paenibacillus marchantiae]|uniref:hypothetical protein n=1 Tax=Paenibacillus marchantiae TaxID=3026433 RepID=UPI00237C51B6|nr:hypothetical protein [Paenibacillus marchantiae]WDQ33871.1 hypothetical protein PTQ21_06170 [Paenibacillus marchantiae]